MDWREKLRGLGKKLEAKGKAEGFVGKKSEECKKS